MLLGFLELGVLNQIRTHRPHDKRMSTVKVNHNIKKKKK